MVVLAGCIADADEPLPIEDGRFDQATARAPEVAPSEVDEVDLCALAASLPAEDACSLMCDPDALAARLVDDGMDTGRCYELRCTLPGIDPMQVGVCLPP